MLAEANATEIEARFDKVLESIRGKAAKTIKDYTTTLESEIEKIVDLMLTASTKRLEDRDIEVSVTDELKKYIAKKGFDVTYGARPLRRAIQNLVEDKLAEEILDGKIKDGDKVKLTYQDGEVKIV